ncbi:MAG: FlgD immunoglobulin-like domain containing protein [Candidatus Cloacimonadales bacterium]|nr:FlgD immunoglobulin-like domain containing protein [Candidatus Cloacimonadales bacterium]
MKKISFIAVLILLPVLLICTTWTVKQDQTGDFETIGEALSSPSVVNGDVIIVYEGTYYENVTISDNITLRSRGAIYTATTIIDGSQNATGTIITVDNALSDVVIQGLTIQSNTTASGTGIYIQNDAVLVTECVIKNIRFGVHVQGWDTPYRTPVIEDNKIYDNCWGIFVNSVIRPDIVGNEIYSNDQHGIDLAGDYIVPGPGGDPETIMKISSNEIYGHDGLTSAAIYSTMISMNLYFNLIYDNTYAILTNVEPDAINLLNDTVCDNRYFVNEANDMDIVNSIIRENDNFLAPISPYFPTPYTINYSCIQQTNVQYSGGTGVITQDPLFVDVSNDNYNLKWTSTQKSPCIDTGDPNSSLDPDDTRADMGALYLDHDVKTYEFEGPNGAHDGWTWLCFDILDILNASTTNQVQNLLEPIQLDLDHGEHEDIWFEYIYPDWTNGTELVISPKGFKIEMDSENSIYVSGFRCVEITTFDLYAEAPVGNWIGYFVDKTQHVYDAFGDYLDVITSIQHQEWSVKRTGENTWPDVGYTLSPGDMVVVECEEDIEDFCWVRESEAERFIVQEPQSFSYTEEADYIPIYIDLDPENMPDEIGVLLDGECKGATVVQDTLANICAYITGSQGGTLEFEFSYGSRGVNTNYKEYLVYEPETGYRKMTTIDLKEKQDHYYVSFRSPSGNGSDEIPVKLSASNYPNPFNPTTTISYDLPSDGKIELTIFNMKGQIVKNLVSGTQPAGNYSVNWDGKNEAGDQVSSGVYFYQITTSEKTLKNKMLLLK